MKIDAVVSQGHCHTIKFPHGKGSAKRGIKGILVYLAGAQGCRTRSLLGKASKGRIRGSIRKSLDKQRQFVVVISRYLNHIWGEDHSKIRGQDMEVNLIHRTWI